MATHSSVLAWRIPWTESLAGYVVPGVARSQTRLHASTHPTDATALTAGWRFVACLPTGPGECMR